MENPFPHCTLRTLCVTEVLDVTVPIYVFFHGGLKESPLEFIRMPQSGPSQVACDQELGYFNPGMPLQECRRSQGGNIQGFYASSFRALGSRLYDRNLISSNILFKIDVYSVGACDMNGI